MSDRDLGEGLIGLEYRLNRFWGSLSDPEDRIHYDNVLIAIRQYASTIGELIDNENESGDVLQAIETLIKELNRINDECGGGAIETVERDMIVPFVLQFASEAGLSLDEYQHGDPTYDLREF